MSLDKAVHQSSLKRAFWAANRLISADRKGKHEDAFPAPTPDPPRAPPMSPPSPAFFAFAPIVVPLYWACYRWKQARLCILLLANTFFLARLAWFYPILLLAAASIDFLVGLDLERIPRERTNPPLIPVSVSVILNVGLLTATKFIPVVMGELYRWVFPLSLSFYCFQSMTYPIDLYRGTRPGTRSYLTHLTSASLFTVIIAGPINRLSDLIKQLQQPFSLTQAQGGRAFLLIMSGLIKKLL